VVLVDGTILFEGTPEELVKVKGSFTAEYLKTELPVDEIKKPVICSESLANLMNRGLISIHSD
jgi:hypothetical protein